MKNAFDLMAQAARRSKNAHVEKQKVESKDLAKGQQLETLVKISHTVSCERSPSKSDRLKESSNDITERSHIISSTSPIFSHCCEAPVMYSDDVSADESSDAENETSLNSQTRVKRLRKRVSHRRSSSEENISPKRQRKENTFSGRSFSIGEDESILQKKPRRPSFVSKQIKGSGINIGVVPSIFRSLDERRAASKAQKLQPLDDNLDNILKHWPIILPQSIAQTTAKEINRLTGQIIELEDNPYPKISIVGGGHCAMKILTHLADPPLLVDFRSGPPSILNKEVFKQINDHENDKDEPGNENVLITSIDEDQARQEVKKLESKNLSFSIRPMLRRFLLYKTCSDKQYLDMFNAKVSEDLLGLEQLANEFANWLVSYSVIANQMIECLKNKGSLMDDDQLWVNSEAACIGVVSGPTGIGKTSFVRAVAADLNYKVIEINSAQCRSQKALMSQLRDGALAQKLATADNGAKSIILMDDADITLIEDTNFHQAISTIAEVSDKPVILTIANNQVLSNIKVSCKLFELPFNRIEAIRTLLQCICIARRVKIEDSIIESIAKVNNFHRSIIELQLVLENQMPKLIKNVTMCANFTEAPAGTEELNVLSAMKKTATKIQSKCNDLDEDDDYKTDINLKICSSLLDSIVFAYPLKVNATFQSPDSSVTFGETQEDPSSFHCTRSDHLVSKVQSTEQLENISRISEITSSYTQNGSNLKKAKYVEVLPFLGLIGIVDERWKNVLELQGHRKSKRYCPYLEQCNLGLSDDIQCWLKDFYSF